MRIIFIHGRAQEGKDPKLLKMKWVNSFKEGLDNLGLNLPINEDNIHLPFYGNTLDNYVKKHSKIFRNIETKGDLFEIENTEFFNDFILELASNSNISTNTKNHLNERGILNWNWIQNIIRTIDQNTSWSEIALRNFIFDVYLYLTNLEVKTEINNLIIDDIKNEPCIIVSHSLGSVIAYNILIDHPNKNISNFFTIGSPLGIKCVNKHLINPLRMPRCIKNRWINAFDKRDLIAINPLDNNHFNIQPPILNINTINNTTKNKHGIEGYLNSSEIALEIYKSLQ